MAMTAFEVLKFCIGRVSTSWTATPIQYADAENLNHDALDEFVKFDVLIDDMASRFHDAKPGAILRGTTNIQVYVRSGGGPGRKFELAEIARTVFDRVNTDGLFFGATKFIDSGPYITGQSTVSDNWTTMHCVTPFWTNLE